MWTSLSLIKFAELLYFLFLGTFEVWMATVSEKKGSGKDFYVSSK